MVKWSGTSTGNSTCTTSSPTHGMMSIFIISILIGVCNHTRAMICISLMPNLAEHLLCLHLEKANIIFGEVTKEFDPFI